MPAPTLVDVLESYIQGEKIKWNGGEPTPAEFADWAARWAMQYGPSGWPLGGADLQAILDSKIAEYNTEYVKHYPPPPPVTEQSPLGYNFGDGSYAPTTASLEGKSIGDTRMWPLVDGATYKLVNYQMTPFNKSPRWVLQP